MAREVHVAIIGAGYWGYKLIREYIQLSKEKDYIKLSAVIDLDKNKLLKVHEELGLPRNMLIDNPDYILNNDSIDAVHIATPNETHYELATKMLENNKHVLLEKPMALSSRDAFKLVRLAEVTDKVLLVGHIFRFNNALRKIKEILSNSNKKVYYIDLNWSAYLVPPPKNRDIIFDLAPHPIDILNFLLEEWPQEVYTVGITPIRKIRGLEETAYSTLKLPNNVVASIKLSWLERGPKKRHVNITTEDSTIFIDALTQEVMIYQDDKEYKVPLTPSNTIREMIDHFIKTILHDEAPNNSALIGALTVVALEGMRKSLEENKPVKLPL